MVCNKVITLIAIFLVVGCASISKTENLIFKAAVFDKLANNTFDNSYVETIEVDEENEVVKYDDGKVIIKLKECENENWICIFDGNLNFAIPKNWNSSVQSWDYQNIKYSVIKDEKATVSHLQEEMYFILAKQDEYSKIYLYSQTKGLLGITMFVAGRERSIIPITYILQK